MLSRLYHTANKIQRQSFTNILCISIWVQIMDASFRQHDKLNTGWNIKKIVGLLRTTRTLLPLLTGHNNFHWQYASRWLRMFQPVLSSINIQVTYLAYRSLHTNEANNIFHDYLNSCLFFWWWYAACWPDNWVTDDLPESSLTRHSGSLGSTTNDLISM